MAEEEYLAPLQLVTVPGSLLQIKFGYVDDRRTVGNVRHSILRYVRCRNHTRLYPLSAKPLTESQRMNDHSVYSGVQYSSHNFAEGRVNEHHHCYVKHKHAKYLVSSGGRTLAGLGQRDCIHLDRHRALLGHLLA